MDTERNGRGDTARNLTVIIIPCDHDEAIWTSDLRNPDYRTFQGLVDGLIEFIDLPHGGSLVCNEESKLIRLPLNYRATALLWLMRPEYIQRDFIAGDVVVAGVPDEEGDTTAAPELSSSCWCPTIQTTLPLLHETDRPPRRCPLWVQPARRVFLIPGPRLLACTGAAAGRLAHLPRRIPQREPPRLAKRSARQGHAERLRRRDLPPMC